MAGFAELDRVALLEPVLGIPAGTCGTVLGSDEEASTVTVAFVDMDRRPLGVQAVRADQLRLVDNRRREDE